MALEDSESRKAATRQDEAADQAQNKLHESAWQKSTTGTVSGQGDWTVDIAPGNVGVGIQWGKVLDEPFTEGLNAKMPWTDVVQVSTKLTPHQFKMETGSKDLQSVTTGVTVPYALDPQMVPRVYQRIGGEKEVDAAIITPSILEATKAVNSQYSAEELITKRPEVKEKLQEAFSSYVNQALDASGLHNAVKLGSLAITDLRFTAEFEKAIEAKVQADQAVLQAGYEAQRQRLAADAQAYTITTTGRAQADSLASRAKAFRNPALVQLNAIEKWNGQLPATMMGNQALPFFNITGSTPVVPQEQTAVSQVPWSKADQS